MAMIALVTGASSGMGKAIAKQLRSDGYTVYAAASTVPSKTSVLRMPGTSLRSISLVSPASLSWFSPACANGGVDGS
jgi:NAD(P)-dependent dehydrogenase (short-subunit alcohol dehydrogenase family)